MSLNLFNIHSCFSFFKSFFGWGRDQKTIGVNLIKIQYIRTITL